jgi:YVTN family beta-propeller protein
MIASSGLKGTPSPCDPKTGDTRVFVPDGGHARVLVFGACPGRFLASIPVGNYPSGIKSTPDGKTLLVTNMNAATISFIDAASYAVTGTMTLPMVDGVMAHPAGIAITPDGTKAYVANHVDSGNGPVVLSIDIASKKVLGLLRTPPFPTAVRVTPDGSQVWVTCPPDGVIYVFDVLTDTLVTRINVPLAGDMRFLPDGTKAYIGTVDSPGFITILDMITYKQIKTIKVADYPGAVIASPTGRQVFVGHVGTNVITMIDTNKDVVFRTMMTKRPTRVLTFLR